LLTEKLWPRQKRDDETRVAFDVQFFLAVEEAAMLLKRDDFNAWKRDQGNMR
jgi:hypothetical protein